MTASAIWLHGNGETLDTSVPFQRDLAALGMNVYGVGLNSAAEIDLIVEYGILITVGHSEILERTESQLTAVTRETGAVPFQRPPSDIQSRTPRR